MLIGAFLLIIIIAASHGAAIPAAVLAALGATSAAAWAGPPVGGFLTWLAGVGTIPISYQTRILGALESVIVKYEKSIGHDINHITRQKFTSSDLRRILKGALYNPTVQKESEILIKTIEDANSSIDLDQSPVTKNRHKLFQAKNSFIIPETTIEKYPNMYNERLETKF